jgi:hypothetical protein
MCHTITDVDDSGALLVGGRASPDNALADCWFYHKWLHAWERVDDLPWPLYRHRAVPLGRGCVLISTGRVDSSHISQEYLVWSRWLGWVECVSNVSITPPAAFGAVFVSWWDVFGCNFARGSVAVGIGRFFWPGKRTYANHSIIIFSCNSTICRKTKTVPSNQSSAFDELDT